jgi:hypothetical protein
MIPALKNFEEILDPLGAQSAEFFLAASLYHSGKVSFQQAAKLAELSFEEFKARLKEHFSTGFILPKAVILNDTIAVEKLFSDL